MGHVVIRRSIYTVKSHLAPLVGAVTPFETLQRDKDYITHDNVLRIITLSHTKAIWKIMNQAVP